MGDDPEYPENWPDGFSLVRRESVESTNDDARQLAIAGKDDGLVVWAKSQTKGRGRRGRDWVSPPGNLYFSIVLRPNLPLSEGAYISILAAVALGDALRSVLSPSIDVLYKWPNDVLVDDAKVAGILLEASGGGGREAVDWIVLGCGVNIVSHPENTLYPTTNLNKCDLSVSAEEFLSVFIAKFSTWRRAWLTEGVSPIRREWLDYAKGQGERITVRSGTRAVQGVFQDLDQDGALMLRLPDGSVTRVTAGDVFFEGA